MGTKRIIESVWADGARWTTHFGRLVRRRGRPSRVSQLFKVIGEKLPFESLARIKEHVCTLGIPPQGVYIAHDSMGCPRYVGRGYIFGRLASHKRAHPLELTYFSFYIVEDKKHENEIETLLIRAAGQLLHFNDRKKRVDVDAGNVLDYEPGTIFYERQRKRGRKA